MLSWNDILVLLPEIYLVVAICILLLLDAWLKPSQRNITHWLAIAITVVTGLLCIFGQPDGAAYAFGGMFVRDGTSEIIKIFGLLAIGLIFVFARPYLRERKLHIGEFYSLMLFAALGLMILASAGNLIVVYLGLEMLALASYTLVAMNRDSPLSSEAAIKYFVLSALASGMLLYGMSMVYGATGTLDLSQLAAAAQHVDMPNVLKFGVIFLIVGVAFELGAAPFHMWLPDVYDGSPTPITTMIASVSKLGAFALAYRLLSAFGTEGLLTDQWQLMLAVVAALSLVIGNLVAIVQTNIKRMLGYSTIAHMGFLLLGFVAARDGHGYSAAMFYAVCYALMSTAAFGVLLALSRKGFECDKISDLKGLNKRAPWMAFLMLLAMFSLAGVPPFWGFYAKVLVLQAAIDANMLWLAIVGIVMAIIGLWYYLHVIWVMYFEEPEESVELAPQKDHTLRWVLSINGLALLGVGIYGWGPLLSWCRAAIGV
ncbi:MAG TPA: NADH-quinone oxidoreductase subunit NuoN [Oleiagrimonas sp.]|nr:NADH-quinone oxidoreductase subunit NuoN [Oleiagrimonas sp.]